MNKPIITVILPPLWIPITKQINESNVKKNRQSLGTVLLPVLRKYRHVPYLVYRYRVSMTKTFNQEPRFNTLYILSFQNCSTWWCWVAYADCCRSSRHPLKQRQARRNCYRAQRERTGQWSQSPKPWRLAILGTHLKWIEPSAWPQSISDEIPHWGQC